MAAPPVRRSIYSTSFSFFSGQDSGKRHTAIAQAGKSGNPAPQSKVGLADAKARLVVYADSDVLVALARLERTGAHLASEEGIAAFLDVSAAMRRSLGDRNVPPTDDIRIVLFGQDRQLRQERGKDAAGA